MSDAIDIEELRAQCCPFCSFWKSDHPELGDDIPRIPTLFRSRHTGEWLFTNNCTHSLPIRGPHESKTEAEQAWKDRVKVLRDEWALRRMKLEETLERLKK